MSKNINKLLKQAQKVQAQMMKAQEDFQKKEVEGSAGGGMVKVVLNGANQLVSIKIDPEVVDPKDVEMLEDLIVAAHSNAMEKIKEMSESTFGSITGGLNIPGL
ncbi:MAG: YbaB/EbfC family nucleoid-associated protein [Fibrobacter sp.]|jgi:DNA-binding YbaB/EbfC family protein|nr:YbaB/EbfC family nucleoid-associated protein [Fibrobacter sp.]